MLLGRHNIDDACYMMLSLAGIFYSAETVLQADGLDPLAVAV